MSSKLFYLFNLVLLLCVNNKLVPQTNRFLHYPDVSEDQIVFVHSGELWLVSKNGGVAQRLPDGKGGKIFPRFSPDGKKVAFSATIFENTDVFVLSLSDQKLTRITYHPLPDLLVDWYPDGRSLLFSSGREFPVSAYRPRLTQLFKVSAEGGTGIKLPVSCGAFGSVSHDGKVVAIQPNARDWWQSRPWEIQKRYRGGLSPEIWLFNTSNQIVENITKNPANDELPMFHGNTIYFLSDRDKMQRSNIWAYNVTTKAFRQLTFFKDFDIQYPAIGPSDLVFVVAGQLYLFDLKTEKYKQVPIKIAGDTAGRKTFTSTSKRLIQNGRISPSGEEIVFETRGDILIVPVDSALKVQNLTQTSGVAERYPSWSPDGKKIAYVSDRSGEYEVTVRDTGLLGKETLASSLGPGFRYHLYWSPKGTQIAFFDEKSRICIQDLEKRKTIVVDTSIESNYALERCRVSWSPDGGFLAYQKNSSAQNTRIWIYDVGSQKKTQLTSGFSSDSDPVFSADGRYLFYFTKRPGPLYYSDINQAMAFANSTRIAVSSLRSSTDFLIATPDVLYRRIKSGAGTQETDSETKRPSVADFASFEYRAQILPIPGGNFSSLLAAPGKIFYRRLPRTGSSGETSQVQYFDIEELKQKTVSQNAIGFDLSPTGKKLLVWSGQNFSIVDVGPVQTSTTKLNIDRVEVRVNPPEEWKQVFVEAWRLSRDYFYDPKMHGVDWMQIRSRYEPLLTSAVTKNDVNYLIGEMVGELNCSHFVWGGGEGSGNYTYENPRLGMLGADFSLENGFYRIKKILQPAAGESDHRSPLQVAGIKTGSYLIAVNGKMIDTSQDLWAAFDSIRDPKVRLTINEIASNVGGSDVVVETVETERYLRTFSWMEQNRRIVEAATNGQVGYIYIVNTSPNGYTDFIRQFMANRDKKGVIIDIRYNHGGMTPDPFLELLARERVGFDKTSFGTTFPWPRTTLEGPRVLLMNKLSGSGGDFFAEFFKKRKMGILIGTRTWGGGVGNGGNPSFIDGGTFAIPLFPIYYSDGKLISEGVGTPPDIEVDDFYVMKESIDLDPQLSRAIQEIKKQLKQFSQAE